MAAAPIPSPDEADRQARAWLDALAELSDGDAGRGLALRRRVEGAVVGCAATLRALTASR